MSTINFKSASGKVRVTPPNTANSILDRYEFMSLDLAEPNLGVPNTDDLVLASKADGTHLLN